MSEAVNPSPETPETPSAAPAAAVPAGQPRPPGDDRRPKRPFRPKGDRPQRREEPKAEPLPDLSAYKPNLNELNSQIEADLEAAMAGFSAEALVKDPLEKALAAATTTPGGGKRGKIVSIHGEDVFVDLPGGRSQGLISIDQFDGKIPEVGSEIEVDIEGYDRANGLLKLTKRGSVQHVDWSSVSEGAIVEARVTETNKGGLTVEVNGIRGFMPISQIDLYRVEQPEQFVNQRLRCMVTEVKPDERNLVVSRRAIMEKDRDLQRESFWSGVSVGQVRTGTIRSVLEFGAFVDLGGADGLVPVSEISWERVENPNDVLKQGQQVQVKIVRIDPTTRKIGLSIKQLQTSPWDTMEQQLPVGAVVAGKVTRLAEFGAFVEVLPGIEGLVHISELAPHRVRKASSVVSVGQDVSVRVQSIDRENRRISLSIKDAMSKAEPEPVEEPEVQPTTPTKPRKLNYQLRGGMGGGKPFTFPE